MTKAFENYEIWWVTGAQLLYGGDAVVKVDGHSKEMVEGLNNYRSYNKRYNYTFDGDDQLTELNEGISELASENFQLRKRLVNIRNASKTPEETDQA